MKRVACITIMVMILFSLAQAKVGEVVKVIKTPGPCPTGLAYDGRFLWLADSRLDKIFKIDPASGQVIKSFDAPGFHPEGLAWDGKYLWHVDSAEKLVYCLDPETGKVLKALESNSDLPRDLAWDGHDLWMTDVRQKSLLRVSPVDGMMIQTFSAPGSEPAGLEFDGHYLWVADRTMDRIFLVDPSSGWCLSSLRSYGPFPAGLAFDGEYLWNVDYENDELYRIKVFDNDIMTLWDKKELELRFVKEFRNYGPGVVTNLDIYLPIPASRDNQELLSPVEFLSKPTEMIRDSWGQQLAHFNFKNLKAPAMIQTGWTVKARIYAVEHFIYPDRVGSLDQIPAEIKEKYLADGDKYCIHDPFIQNLAKKIAGNEKNPYWITRKIYEYLIDHLSYNLKPVGGWNPAPTVLRRGTASCSEYTYSLIALCRALGVPARYVGTVSLRGDDASYDDVFHRWNEVYLPPYGWIPFDANKGDVEAPGGRALGIGNVAARYIITTENGGGDQYLWFGYNYGYTWTAEGRCRLSEESYGEWQPLGPKKYQKPAERKSK
ncbi:MAG TPA: transglutaminase domain-containing protein [Candidatus Saccharicenans sp.]|nr:transglutaminase domain-containing protein [Candidatus Saccharicenans sp.]